MAGCWESGNEILYRAAQRVEDLVNCRMSLCSDPCAESGCLLCVHPFACICIRRHQTNCSSRIIGIIAIVSIAQRKRRDQILLSL